MLWNHHSLAPVRLVANRRSLTRPCRPAGTILAGASFVLLILVMSAAAAAGQTGVRRIVSPPAPAPAAHKDPLHPPPAPYSDPRYPVMPGLSRAPLPTDFPADREIEDPSNLIWMWNHRQSAEAMHASIEQSMRLPFERPPSRAASGPPPPGGGGMGPLAAVSSSWSQLGGGDINNDGVHYTSGRERQATYAYDNEQSATVLWLGATGGGVWRAVLLGIFGAVFVPVSDNLPGSPSVGAFLVQPGNSNNILIGSGDSYRYGGSGMYKTTNEGGSWSYVPPPSGSSWPSAFQKIIDDYGDSSGNTVLAEGDNGIFRSTDFGSTWTQVYSGSTSDLVQDPNYSWIWYAGAPGIGVLRSTSYGASFAPIGSGIPSSVGRVSVAVSAAASWHVYALGATSGTSGGLAGIWRSDDYGDGTWTAIESTDHISWGQAFHTCAINVDPADADRVFCGMGGMQWTQNATANPPTWNYNSDAGHADNTSFTFESGTTNVIITNDGGAYAFDYSANSVSGTLNELGLSCEQVMGPPNCLAGSYTVPDLLLAGLQDNGMLRIDRNDSPVILKLGGGDGGAASIDPDDSNGFYFSSGEAYNRYYSTDAGNTWNNIEGGLNHDWVPTSMIDQTPSNGFTPDVYTYDGQYVYYSPITVLGGTWYNANSNPLPSTWSTRLLDASNDTNAYVFYLGGWSTGQLLVMDSYSDGALGSMTYEDRTPPLLYYAYNDDMQIAADRSSLRPYTVTYVTGASWPPQAFISNDRGQTWTEVTGDIANEAPNIHLWKLIANPNDQTQMFLATDSGVFRSDNGGANWYHYMNGLPAVESVDDMELNYDYSSPPLLHIGTYGRGFWDRQVADDAALNGLTLLPATSEGGFTTNGTIYINKSLGNAISVSLSSDNSSLASVPSTVTINAGATSASFPITVASVTSQQSVGIHANYNEVTDSATLTIDPWLKSVGASPSVVCPGVGATGTVYLNNSAISPGATVNLSSSAPTVVSVPATVTVPQLNSQATFSITPASTITSNKTVTISASYQGVTVNTTITAKPLLATLSASPSSVTGGNGSTGKVTLNAPAPTNIVLSLKSSSADVGVPSSVTINSNSSSATFPITTSVVTSQVTAKITTSYGGVTKSASVTVKPATLSSLKLSPTSVVGGTGGTSTGTVTLTGKAPTGGITVTLSSSSTDAKVPASVTVAAGTTSKTFTVTTVKVTATVKATIKAVYGSVSKTAALTIKP